jgi:CRP-like cAMP-binding protein
MEKFSHFLRYQLCLDSKAQELIQKLAISSNYRQGAMISVAGEAQEKLYFVEDGVLRVFSYHRDLEWTRWFHAKGELIVTPESIFNTINSEEYIEACCPCTLISLKKQDFFNLVTEYGDMWSMFRHQTDHYSKKVKEHLYNLSFLRASDRYYKFVEEYPYVCRQVQNKHIASYLGTHPEVISRLRRIR